MAPILFKYVPIERIWGGNALRTKFHRDIPLNSRIGETWELSDNSAIRSEVSSGCYAGKTLRWLLKNKSAEIMGPGWNPDDEFPILVKWLDCEHPLSVQVHPTDCVARKYGDKAKDECWYIVSCGNSGSAEIIVGLKEGVSKERFASGIEDLSFENFLLRVSVSEGDSVFLPAGTIHSIISPTLIYEVQQNSDSTYRVYDWGRVDSDGKSRPLHVEKSIETINFSSGGAFVERIEDGVICRSEHFTEYVRILEAGDRLSFEANVQPRILTVISGMLKTQDGGEFRTFDTMLLPYSQECEFVAAEKSKVIITEDFA